MYSNKTLSIYIVSSPVLVYELHFANSLIKNLKQIITIEERKETINSMPSKAELLEQIIENFSIRYELFSRDNEKYWQY